MALTVHISAYEGSKVGTNWTPCILAALDAIKGTGGVIDLDKDIQIETTVRVADVAGWTGYVPLHFKGNNSNVVIKCPGVTAFELNGNLLRAKFSDIVFTGDPNPSTWTCSRGFLTLALESNVFENCSFFGVRASTDAIIYAWNNPGALFITNCVFGGTAANGPHVLADGSESLVMENVGFYDYGSYRGVDFSGPQIGVNQTWIKHVYAGTPATSHVPLTQLRNVRTDEAFGDFGVFDGVPRVSIVNCAANLRSGVTSSIYLKNVTNGRIERFWAGYRDTGNSVKIENCGHVTIDGLQQQGGTHPVVVDGSTKFTEIRNSPGAVVQADAKANYAINGILYRGGVRQSGRVRTPLL